jgi:hypothetical protein
MALAGRTNPLQGETAMLTVKKRSARESAHAGFSMKFKNGYTVSVAWGRHAHAGQATEQGDDKSSAPCGEVLVEDGAEKNVTTRFAEEETPGDGFASCVTADQLVDILYAVRNHKL